MANDSRTPTVVELAGDVAKTPMPRFANAAHNSFLFAPALLTRSAWRMALRACRKVGFAGERFIPSVSSWRMSWLPMAHPCLLLRLALASQSAEHHPSPWLCTESAVDPITGLRGMPVCALACPGS